MQVAAAYSAPFYGDESLMLSRLWGGDVDDADVVSAKVLCCFRACG